MRAKKRAAIVLGSATPAIESMYNARSGKYNLVEITHRADGANLPKIHIIDMSTQRKTKWSEDFFRHFCF